MQLFEVIDFQDCLRGCRLDDMKWRVTEFTWSNKQKVDKKVCSKIDRVLINDELMSNHALALVQLGLGGDRGKSTLKFCNMWVHSQQFLWLVKEVWRRGVWEIRCIG